MSQVGELTRWEIWLRRIHTWILHNQINFKLKKNLGLNCDTVAILKVSLSILHGEKPRGSNLYVRPSKWFNYFRTKKKHKRRTLMRVRGFSWSPHARVHNKGTLSLSSTRVFFSLSPLTLNILPSVHSPPCDRIGSCRLSIANLNNFSYSGEYGVTDLVGSQQRKH